MGLSIRFFPACSAGAPGKKIWLFLYKAGGLWYNVHYYNLIWEIIAFCRFFCKSPVRRLAYSGIVPVLTPHPARKGNVPMEKLKF